MNVPASMSRAWWVVVLLMPVALLNYMDRQLLAAMKFSVMADITDISSEANWGRMLGQFKWMYAFLSPLGGYLSDRYGRRLTICGSLFAWSAVTWWTGHAASYSELLAARTLMGVSEAFYIPAALALITDVHTGATRSRAVSLHQTGIYLGVILGGFSGYVAENPDLGWRRAFDACGLLGMLYAVPLAWGLRGVSEPGEERRREEVSAWSSVSSLLRNSSFVLLVLYFTLPALAGWVVRDWMPAILKVEFAIGEGKAGVSATLYWQAAAIVGGMLGGWIADRWVSRTPRGRIFTSVSGMALIVPAIYGVGYAPRTGMLWVAVGFLILFGLGWGFFDSNNMPILCQIVPAQMRATGYGIMNLVSISAGGLADWGFGILRDRGVPLAGIFSIFAGAALFSALLALFIKPRDFGRPSNAGAI